MLNGAVCTNKKNSLASAKLLFWQCHRDRNPVRKKNGFYEAEVNAEWTMCN